MGARNLPVPQSYSLSLAMHYVDGQPVSTVSNKAIRGFFNEYRWLSNFYLSAVTVRGITYPSSEHAFQALKTKDESLRQQFAQLKTPYAAKQLGRKITLRKRWDDPDFELRLKAMKLVIKCKFHQNSELRNLLIATGDKYLEETNSWGGTLIGVAQSVTGNRTVKTISVKF